MPTQDEHKMICKFAAGYVPSPLHCGCPECCPALATAERRLKTKPIMRIKTSTLLATAKAIYNAEVYGDEPRIAFERLPPLTKDIYGRLATAAAEAINRDYPLKLRITARPDAAEDKSLGANQNQPKD